MADSANRRMPVGPLSSLQKLPSSRIFVHIVDALVDYIDRNGLKKGHRLDGEGEIAAKLGVSRPSLRQALRILENAGVVTVRSGQGGGVFVDCDVLPLTIIQQSIESEAESLQNLLVTRHLIEPIAMHLAAERATREDLEGIEAAIDLMEDYRGSTQYLVRVDGTYHRRVAYASHDDVLARSIVTLYRRLLPLRYADVENMPDPEHMVAVHRRQLEAIRKRDHERIDKLITESFVDLERDNGFSFPYDVVWRER